MRYGVAAAAGLLAAGLAAGAAPVALAAPAAAAEVAVLQQGKGQGQQQDNARGRSGERGRAAQPERGGAARGQEARGRSSDRGRSAAPPADAAARGRPAARGERRAERAVERAGRETVATPRSSRASGRALGPRSDELLNGALTRGRGRGLGNADVAVRREGNRTRLVNRRGHVLVDMDDDRAREMGGWRLRRMGDQRPRGNAPAFCRSGEGHPVWGREWCVEKGFGLGSRDGTLWSRGRVEDVVFRRGDDRARLERPDLISVLGDVVFGRLALHSVALGFDEPLVGLWVTDPAAPRLLRVYAGDEPVAEFVDRDRDDRPEVLYVVQPL